MERGIWEGRSGGRTTLVACVLLLVAASCDWLKREPAGPSTIVQQSQTVVIGATPAPSPSPSPSAVPAGFCATPSAPVTYVRFGLRTGGSCRVDADRGCAVVSLARGSALTLDITPLSGSEPVLCHGLLGLELAGTGCEKRSGGGTDFLPVIAGLSTDDCKLTATVNGVSNTLSIEVR